MADENKPGVGAYVKDIDANAAIAEIAKNRSMLVAKLTSDPAIKPEVVTGLTNPEDVFEHFKPNVELGFEDEEGAEKKEQLKFKNLGDFGKKGIVNQSEFLKGLDAQQENNQKFIKQLKSNKILKAMLANPEAKAAYIETLKSLIEELESSGE